MIRVMVDMSATLLHHGHVRLIQQAKEYGHVVIGLTTDEEIKAVKGYVPELSFAERKEIIESINGVDEVVPTPWLIAEETLELYSIDYLIHGDDHANPIDESRCKILSRTPAVSSTELRQRASCVLNTLKNKKLMLTPGPAALAHEALFAQIPVFGRGDAEYQRIYERVIDWLKEQSGQDEIICAQGSSTLALEMAAHGFVSGSVLVIDSGYYSNRLSTLLPESCDVKLIPPERLDSITTNFDWVVCAYTETSRATKLDIASVRQRATQLGAKLFVDATGSIGLEESHHLADVMAFSSCKGLMGIAGACFVAYKKALEMNQHPSFYLNLNTHANKMVTGPYHAIVSLYGVMPIHTQLRQRVINSKNAVLDSYSEHIDSTINQPLLCTYLNGKVGGLDENIVLYTPRSELPGSVVCHLGEVHHDQIDITSRIKIEAL